MEEITLGDITYRIRKFSPMKSLTNTMKLGKFLMPLVGVWSDPNLAADGGVLLAAGQLLTTLDEDRGEDEKGLTMEGVLDIMLFSDNVEVMRNGDSKFVFLKKAQADMYFEDMGYIIELVLAVAKVNFTHIIERYIPQFGSMDLKGLFSQVMPQEQDQEAQNQ